MAAALSEAITHSDIRDVLPAISLPTLVLHFEDSAIPVEGGRYLAERIPGARYVELPGQDHMPLFDDVPEVADEIEEFLTGARRPREPERVLATVLFTDIVGSTQRAAALGDAAWRELLERHDATVRAELGRFGGREVKHTGDGFLASFDGPARAIRCAVAIGGALRALDLEVRAGVHTGECEVADGDLRGLGVHIGARVGGIAGPGEVLVSSTVKDLVAGSGIDFEDRGSHVLKGVPGDWRVFAVRSTEETPEAAIRASQQPDEIGAFDRLARVMARRAPGVSRLAARTLARRTSRRGAP
jgi:class 3 adenylate cyclase